MRVACAASALIAISVLLARRIDLSSLAQADVVWRWMVVSLVLNLASVAGKAIVWKTALDALPNGRPVRYAHVVPALFIGFLLNRVLFARMGEVARVAVLARRQRLAGEPIPTGTIAGTAIAEQLVLGIALALCVLALALALHLPHAVWALAGLFVLGLAAVLAALMILLRSARGRVARLLAGVSHGQVIYGFQPATPGSQPR